MSTSVKEDALKTVSDRARRRMAGMAPMVSLYDVDGGGTETKGSSAEGCSAGGSGEGDSREESESGVGEEKEEETDSNDDGEEVAALGVRAKCEPAWRTTPAPAWRPAARSKGWPRSRRKDWGGRRDGMKNRGRWPRREG